MSRRNVLDRFLLIAFGAGCLLTARHAAYASEPDAATAPADFGARVFAEKCADCHGERGEGTDYYAIPLYGDLPVRELARVIADTMPEGEPETCVGDEAMAVAEHVHAAFYSPIAQARNRPARRALARLTGAQYRQSLADLVAELTWRRPWGNERGVSAVYEARRNANHEGRVAELVHPRVDINSSTSDFLPDELRRGPDGDKQAELDRLDLNVHLHGGLLAPTTGKYRLIVESPNGFEFEFNGERVIDARVRSLDEDPRREVNVSMLGGRAYPITLSARRTQQPDLRVRLKWKVPGGGEELIPSDRLAPHWFPRVHTASTNLPPDDRSRGYERAASVSAAWDEATTSAALELVAYLVENLGDFAAVDDNSKEVTADSAREFVAMLAEVAFRRPLTEDERSAFIDSHFASVAAGGSETTTAVERSLLQVLKSPRFLYPEASLLASPSTQRRAYTVASRLALGLWDSLPDRSLRVAAQRGGLDQVDSVRWHARQMLNDTRTRAKLDEFFHHWLRVEHVSGLSRDPERFPDFDERVAHSMRRSLDRMIQQVVWEGDSDLRQLFLTDELPVDGRLAEFLGVEFPGDDPREFVPAPPDTNERAGVVSHPYLVTTLSYYRDTSPIHRGVFLARHVLGRSLRPPPEAVSPVAPELAPELTTRQRVTVQTSPHACQTCHVLINDLGFTLEHFDAVGRFRQEDVGKPINPTGGYIATDGSEARFGGARDLAEFLANSPDVHASFVRQLFAHVTKQPIIAYEETTRESLLNGFRASGFNIRELLVEIATVAATVE